MLKTLLKKLYNLRSSKQFTEILAGSVWALAARVMATGLALVTNIIISHTYGAEMVGIVAMIQAFFLFTTIITVMGTNTSILRMIPEYRSKYSATSAFKIYLKTLYFVGAISLLVALLLFFASDLIASKFFSKPYLSFYFALASGFVVFRSLMDLNTQAVRGLRLIRAFALMQVLPSAAVLLSLLTITFLHGGKNSPVYAQMAAWVFTAVLGLWIVNHFFRKLMQPEDIIQSMSLRNIVSISTPMLVTSSMQFVIGQTGIILLGIFKTDADVGYYAMAVKLATLTSFVLQAVNTIAAPKFSELYHKGAMEELFLVAKKSTQLIFWTTVPILLVLLSIGGPLLGWLFGQEFTTAYPAMALLLVGQFVNSISGSTGYFMNMTGHQKIFRNIMMLAGLINISLGVLLIPRFGLTGAAAAGMASLIFWNLYTLVYIKRKFGTSIGYVPFIVNSL